MTPNDIDGDWKDMNNPAYLALFNSREEAYKRTKELEAQLVYEQERNANNVANADYQIAELRAEITRLREIVYTSEYSSACKWGADHEKANEHAKLVAGEMR